MSEGARAADRDAMAAAGSAAVTVPGNTDFSPAAVADKMRRGPGRQETVKATPETVAAICKNVAQGMSVDGALILAGIGPGNCRRWLARNSLAADLIAGAERAFESEMVQILRGKARSDAKVAQWLLERRMGQTWGAVTRQQITGANGGPVQTLSVSKVLFAQMAVAPDMAAKPVAAPRGVPARAIPASATDTQSDAPRATGADATADDTGGGSAGDAAAGPDDSASV